MKVLGTVLYCVQQVNQSPVGPNGYTCAICASIRLINVILDLNNLIVVSCGIP